MNLIERVKAPTPKFFRILRSIGLALLTIGGTVATAPVALPAVVVTVGGYMAVAGGVLSAVSQVTIDSPPSPLKEEQNAGASYETENLNKARDGN